MILSQSQKKNIKSTLFPLLLALQISACSTEDSTNTEGFNAFLDIQEFIDTNTETNPGTAISGVDSGSIVEDLDPDGDNLLEVGGKLNITNHGIEVAAFSVDTINGNYGSLTINATGDWNYAANNSQSAIQNLASGETLTDSLTVSNSIDSVTHSVVITIIGADEVSPPSNTNSPAIFSGTSAGTIIEDIDPDNDNLLEVSGKLNITDSDPGEAAFIANTINGNYGSLTINAAGNWNYAANNNQSIIQNLASGASLTDRLTVSSVDSTTHTVVITIFGADEANHAAVISGSDRGSVTEDVDPDNDNLLEVSGKLNITDSDAGEAAFIANTINGNYGSLTINAAGNWNYAANNNQSIIQNLSSGTSLTDRLTVSSVDSTTHTVVITIIGENENNITADITLSWVAPSEREDNTSLSLSEISGYKVFYGTTENNYTNSININDSTADGYTFRDFTTGTYYFIVTTIDTDGRESQSSPVVDITI